MSAKGLELLGFGNSVNELVGRLSTLKPPGFVVSSGKALGWQPPFGLLLGGVGASCACGMTR